MAIPVEDLTDGWQQSGQVGQEVYGSALAFVAATRHFRPLPGTHLRFHCDYPLTDFTATGRPGALRFRLMGDARGMATIRLIPTDPNRPTPIVTCSIARPRRRVAPTISPEGHIVFRVRGDAVVKVGWRSQGAKAPRG